MSCEKCSGTGWIQDGFAGEQLNRCHDCAQPPKPAAPVITADERTAMARVLSYLEALERYHWETTGKPADHIWTDVQVLKAMLERVLP